MLARFEREDKVLASLDHRNIAIIYADEEALGQLSPDSRSGRREVYVDGFHPAKENRSSEINEWSDWRITFASRSTWITLENYWTSLSAIETR